MSYHHKWFFGTLVLFIWDILVIIKNFTYQICWTCLTTVSLIKPTFPKTSDIHLSLVITLKVFQMCTLILNLIDSVRTFEAYGNMTIL